MRPEARTTLAVTTACVVATVCYSGSVTGRALLLFVLPSVLVTALVATAARTQNAAAVTAPMAVLACAWLANTLAGNTEGPAARSTAVAAAGTAITLGLLRSRVPAAFPLGVSVIVAGALALGAGGEVRLVAVVTAAACALALAVMERDRRQWTVPPRRGLRGGLAVLLVAAAASVAVVSQATQQGAPVVLDPASASSQVKPALPDPFPNPVGVGVRSTADSSRSEQAASGGGAVTSLIRRAAAAVQARIEAHSWSYWTVTAVLLLLLLLVLLITALIVRRLARGWARRRLRRRLSSGNSTSAVTGAWLFLQHSNRRATMLPPGLSPDRVAAHPASAGLAPEVTAPLGDLAVLVTKAAFRPEALMTRRDAQRAWELADAVSHAGQHPRGAARHRGSHAVRPRLVGPLPVVTAK